LKGFITGERGTKLSLARAEKMLSSSLWEKGRARNGRTHSRGCIERTGGEYGAGVLKGRHDRMQTRSLGESCLPLDTWREESTRKKGKSI